MAFVVAIILQAMLVLGLDTTTRAGSCAVARDGVVLREQGGDATRPHETRLPGDLMTLLLGGPEGPPLREDERIALDAIDVFAVATGPGSFTGLRIGIATMQGLAFAAGKPLIGVSGFDALAQIAISPGPLRGTRPTDSVGRVPRSGPAVAARSGPAGHIATWVDAWRGDVFAALYEDGVEVEGPSIEHPDRLLARYRAGAGLKTRPYIVFVGDAADTYREVILGTLGDAARIAEPAAPLLAGTIARIATESARDGHRPPPHAIRPIYVRRPDAEPVRHARPVG